MIGVSERDCACWSNLTLKLLTPRCFTLPSFTSLFKARNASASCSPTRGGQWMRYKSIYSMSRWRRLFSQERNTCSYCKCSGETLVVMKRFSRPMCDFSYRASEQILRVALGVALSRVEVGIAHFQRGAQGGQRSGIQARVRIGTAADAPGAKADLGNGKSVQGFIFHF